jgi:hypothetical protein
MNLRRVCGVALSDAMYAVLLDIRKRQWRRPRRRVKQILLRIATFIYIHAQLTLSSGRTNVLNLRARNPLADYHNCPPGRPSLLRGAHRAHVL